MRSSLGSTLLVAIAVACSSGTDGGGQQQTAGAAGEAPDSAGATAGVSASAAGSSQGATAGTEAAGGSEQGGGAGGSASGAGSAGDTVSHGGGGAPPLEPNEGGGAGLPSTPIDGGAAGAPTTSGDAGAPPSMSGGGGAGGEPSAAPCVCDSGPCCDGCHFRPKSHFCGEVVRDSYCSGNDVQSCSGATERITLDYWNLFCNGDSSECTRWALHTKYVSTECDGVSVCVEGSEQASCQACP